MSFRRTTEEGEIGEEEGEITGAASSSSSPDPPQRGAARLPFRRNSTGVLPGGRFAGRGGRFPGRGGRGGRGGAAAAAGGRGMPRHSSWSAGQGPTAGEQTAGASGSRWGPSNSTNNEPMPRRDTFPRATGGPPPPPPISRNPSFVGSSGPPAPIVRKPSFSRGESAGTVGALQPPRNFPPTPPFARNETFGRSNEPPRNEPVFRPNSGENESFQNAAPFSRQESFGRTNEHQRNELPFRGNAGTNESFAPVPNFTPSESFGRGNEPQRNEPFRPGGTGVANNEGFPPNSPPFSRSESFGRANEQPRTESFRGNANANESFQNLDAFGRLERNRSEAERDAFGRHQQQPQQQQPPRMEQTPLPPNAEFQGHISRSPASVAAPPPAPVAAPPPPRPGPPPPPPPPNLPPPPLPPPTNLPPPPPPRASRTSSYSSLAMNDPPLPPPPPPTLPLARSPSKEYHGGIPPPDPSMARRASTMGDRRPPMRSPPQKDRRKAFDQTSSPMLSRQSSAPSRFNDGADSFRSSLPAPPPLTSSQLLAQPPRQEQAASSVASSNRPWPHPSSPEAPKKKKVTQASLSTTHPAEPSPAKPKAPQAPLTCSSLGDATVAARAEKVISQMNELVSLPQTSTGDGVLPSKQLIMKAVAGLDQKIKKGQTDTKSLETELEEMIRIQEIEAKRAEKERLEQEQRRQEAESKKLEEARRAMEEKRIEEHRNKVQVEITERRRILSEAQAKAREELEARIEQVKKDEQLIKTREIQAQMAVVAQNFDRDIGMAQKSLNEAVKATALSEENLANISAEYTQSKEDDSAPLDISDQKEGQSRELRELVCSIQAENKMRAQQAQVESLSALVPHFPNAQNSSRVMTNEQWANQVRAVTGLANAIYTEPSQSPFFDANNQVHALIEPVMTEVVREKRRVLDSKLGELATEYLVRKDIYDKTHLIIHKEKHSKPVSHPSIFGSKPSSSIEGSKESSTVVSGGRSTSNPYRRARRGNGGNNSGDVVRSEYEQEQIIAELTAKEAMEKRIKHGGCELPRQVCELERKLNGTYITTFESRHIDDPLKQAEEQRNTNVWSDMEKCIFLDRFLQHPKNFRKIASFLRNKSTKDCVSFYYDSKQSVPYKMALKEHIMRRKRRGDYHVWDATIQASLSMGAVVRAGPNESKPLSFSLPESDKTYVTRNFHPLNHELLDRVTIAATDTDVEEMSPQRRGKSRKRSAAPLFTLDPGQRKFLRTSTGEKASAEEGGLRRALSSSDMLDAKGSEKTTPVRKASQKWTTAEKKLFHDIAGKHGKNWSKLASAISSKTVAQIKKYYYDHKKHFDKKRGGGEKSCDSDEGKDTRTSATASTDGESDVGARVDAYGATDTAGQYHSVGTPTSMEVDLTEHQRTSFNAQTLQSAADVWARAQIQQQQEQQHLQQQQEQHLQQQLSSHEARRLLHSQQHQQVISSMFPWVTAAQVAQVQAQQVQAQAVVLQQQQQHAHQEPQHQDGSHRAGWVDPTAQMQNLLAMRQAGHHHGFSVDPSSHLRTMALAGLAAMNQQSRSGNGVMQMDNSSYHSSEPDQGVNYVGGDASVPLGMGRATAQAPSSSNANAAMALGMLASASNGSGYNADDHESREQGHRSDYDQSG